MRTTQYLCSTPYDCLSSHCGSSKSRAVHHRRPRRAATRCGVGVAEGPRCNAVASINCATPCLSSGRADTTSPSTSRRPRRSVSSTVAAGEPGRVRAQLQDWPPLALSPADLLPLKLRDAAAADDPIPQAREELRQREDGTHRAGVDDHFRARRLDGSHDGRGDLGGRARPH